MMPASSSYSRTSPNRLSTPASDRGEVVKRRGCGGRQGKPRNVTAEALQDESHPGSLETRVTRDEYPT